MKIILYSFLNGLLLFALVTGCKKEFSFEGGASQTATGSINCDSFFIHGDFTAGLALTDSNYVTGVANVLAAGAYSIYSDTINGFYFAGSGYFTNPGNQHFLLKGYGQVAAASPTDFVFYFGSESCTQSVIGRAAIYYFAATDGNCDNNKIYGSYTAGEAATAGDSVVVNVNVTATGSYMLQTPEVNGLYFFAKGIFTQLGLQTITLRAAGTPIAGGTNSFPLVNDVSGCGFTITAGNITADPQMYYRFTANGKEYSGILDSARLTYQRVSGADINTVSFRTLIINLSDTIFSLGVSRINIPVTTGTYHATSSIAEDFSGSIDFSYANEFIYGTSKYLPSFQIFLTSYGLANRLVEGTFSGPVMDGQNNTVNITKGKFKTYLRH